MALAHPTASGGSRTVVLSSARSGKRRNDGLRSAAAIAALLFGAGGAAAQDLANTTPFIANVPYTGDVLNNTSTIDNNSTWLGDIIGNANFIDNNAGATWTGDIESNSQTINNFAGASWYGSVSTAGDLKNFGTWEGDVLYNSKKIENHVGAIWYGDVYDNQHKFLNYGTWVGDLYAQTSTGELNSYGDWYGDVIGNAGTIYADGIWTGDVRTNSYRIVTNLLDTSSTETKWIGDVLTNDGTIINYINATWEGDVVDNAGTVSNYSTWNGNLTSRGSVSNIGIWTGNVVNTGAVFRARNQFIGDFDNRGAVQLTGDLAISGLLTNSGRLQLNYTAGAQTLSVGGALFEPTASYEIDVTAIGGADLMLVTGAASLGGTVAVTTSTTGGGTFDDQKSYTILTAGSLEGSFAGVTTDLAFLSPHLSYDSNNVYLGLRRNDVGFAETGATGNQIGVSAAVETLGAVNPIYDAVLWLTPDAARNAFDQLSGEAYGASAGAAIQSAALFRGIALSRLHGPVSGGTKAGSRLWAEAYGARFGGQGGVAALQTDSGGLVLGADAQLADWQLGALLQLGATDASSQALRTRITSTDYGAGIYAGTSWGATRLALGGTYTLHDTDASRTVDFPGFADSLEAGYQASTAQAFAELSHSFDFRLVSLTPYAGLAQVRYSSDGFVETGGPAALTREDHVLDATYTTLGLGLGHSIELAGSTALTARASVGWRHGFGGTPAGVTALAGAPAFAVASAPLEGDLAIFSAGLNLSVDTATDFDLTYDGQFGDVGHSHSLRGTLATAF